MPGLYERRIKGLILKQFKGCIFHPFMNLVCVWLSEGRMGKTKKRGQKWNVSQIIFKCLQHPTLQTFKKSNYFVSIVLVISFDALFIEVKRTDTVLVGQPDATHFDPYQKVDKIISTYLTIIKYSFERKLKFITNYNRYATTNNGIKQSSGRWCITSWTQAKHRSV